MEDFARLLLMLIGAVMVIAFMPDFMRSLSVKSWVSVDGKITHVGISENRGGHMNSYAPQISYEYFYAGRKYQGAAIRITGFSFRYKELADDYLRQFSKGADIKVYVDPGRPDRCALHPGFEWWALFFAVLGLVAFGASFYFLATH
jgi:Protein of unknown function (DUF3592)